LHNILLVKYGEELDLKAILSCWGKRFRDSLLAGAINERATGAKRFIAVPSFIEVFGEVNCLVTDAMKMEFPFLSLPNR